MERARRVLGAVETVNAATGPREGAMRSRRDALKLFAVAAATAGVAGSLTVNPVSSNAPRNYVLVHGAWVGGWIWRRVSDQLAIAGHRVYAPSLTGLGDRQHLLTRETNMDTHIRDIIALIEMEELRDVILVGHSYGRYCHYWRRGQGPTALEATRVSRCPPGRRR